MGTRLARWAWLPLTVALIALAIALRPDGGSAPASAQEGTETPTPTATPTPDPSVDHDGDGCTAAQEAAMGFDDTKWYDFYDVPVPANPDPTPNGSKNRTVSMGDVLAVWFYLGTWHNHLPNPKVGYDSVKGSCDWNADTTPDEEGVCYDRTHSPDPNPPWDAGPPDGAVSVSGDLFSVLFQVGLDCGGIAGPAPSEGPNAMAIDVEPSTPESIDTTVTRLTGMPFQVGVNVTEATTAYQGYDLLLEYDHSKLAFVPTSDANWDTVPESWDYIGFGDPSWQALVSVSQAGDRLQGGAFTGRWLDPPAATGQAVLATFECVAPGAATVHLVTSGDNPAVFSSTLLPGGAPITTTLSDASVYCDDSTPTPSPTPTDTPTATDTPAPTDTPTVTPTPLAAVGGIAELPDVGAASSQEAGAPSEGSTWSAGAYAALAGGLAAAALATAWLAWYVRRRGLR